MSKYTQELMKLESEMRFWKAQYKKKASLQNKLITITLFFTCWAIIAHIGYLIIVLTK